MIIINNDNNINNNRQHMKILVKRMRDFTFNWYIGVFNIYLKLFTSSKTPFCTSSMKMKPTQENLWWHNLLQKTERSLTVDMPLWNNNLALTCDRIIIWSNYCQEREGERGGRDGGSLRFEKEQWLSCRYEQLLVWELMSPTNICHQWQLSPLLWG